MEPPVIAALVTAGAALAGTTATALTARTNRRTTREQAAELERLKHHLQEEGDAARAYREYQYEARKRLYQEVEPLLFELTETAESAYARVSDIARAGRAGRLGSQRHVLDRTPDDYFLLSTCYRLLAPVAVTRLVQSRLTLVDLGLDRRLEQQYRLARELSLAFSRDHFLAGRQPPLRYEPEGVAPSAPEWCGPVHARQGVYAGHLERAASALLTVEDQRQTLSSFGDVEDRYRNDTRTQQALEPVVRALVAFHPAQRPVLWRVLLLQAHLCRALVTLHRSTTDGGEVVPLGGAVPVAMPVDERAAFEWRLPEQVRNGEDTHVALQEPFEAVSEHISAHVRA